MLFEERGSEHRRRAEPAIAARSDGLEDEQAADAARPAQRRQGREREHGAADRQRGRAGEPDEAVVGEDDPGRGQAVQGEECGHHGEGGAEQDGAAVVSPGADDGQRDRAAVAARAVKPTPAKWIQPPM